jgi:predicted unusual protein kinase regulating ubiquinone biosynthesis (AarF/ABC1/UbiB family)
MADRHDGRVRVKRARIAPLAGLAGQTSGETVAVALARKKGQDAAAADGYAQRLDRSATIAIKAGQMLWTAIVGTSMPAATLDVFRQALTGYTEDPPLMPPELTAQTVRTELGRSPRELFAEFDPTPLATGPICQVHAAVLHDGRRAAVKIRYRGAAQALRSALAGTDVPTALEPLVRAALPEATRAAIRAAAGELRGRVELNIGLLAEAATQAEFATAYQGHPFIRVPGVVPELSAQRMLTMERVDGLGLDQARQADAATRDTWGEVIYRFHAGGARRLGQSIVECDPGNYLFHPDGEVSFLGFGRTRRFAREQIEALRQQARAAVEHNAEDLRRLHWEHCGPGPDIEPERLSGWHHRILRPLTGPQPFTCTPEWAAGVAEARLPANRPCGATTRALSAEPGCRFANDIDTGMAALLGALHASADWNAIRAEWDCGGPPATPLGKLESAWEAARTGDHHDL